MHRTARRPDFTGGLGRIEAARAGAVWPPRPARYAGFVARTNEVKLTIIVIDTLVMACIVFFLAGFGRLIRWARPVYEWLAMLVSGTGWPIAA
jgi:hypothetical protein